MIHRLNRDGASEPVTWEEVVSVITEHVERKEMKYYCLQESEDSIEILRPDHSVCFTFKAWDMAGAKESLYILNQQLEEQFSVKAA